MIIEIFGPPAAGKTTFARSLAADLRRRGLDVELALSYRPAEVPTPSASSGRRAPPFAPAMRRVARPVIETLATAPRLFGNSPEASLARALLDCLPPVSTMWSIRLRQYIWRLSLAWNDARASDRVIVFDQAFVQTLCSLGLLAQPEHADRLPLALRLVPRADFLVAIEAPRERLRQRLIRRERRQGVFERMLEFDLETNLRSVEVIDRLRGLLERDGARIASVASEDDGSQDAVFRQAAQATMERTGARAVLH